MEFGRYYFEHDCGEPYERNERWLAYFGRIAERIVNDLQPESVLDAGCAFGMLVEKLRQLGVDAYGVDVSEYAIEHADDSIREYLWCDSLTKPLDREYDLVVSIEVLEHMPPADAEQAVENICSATDRLLFSSSPFDFAEPTHVNVQAPEDWSAQFTRQGLVRNLGFDASFLTPWAVLYERSHATLPEVVRAYDRSWWRLRTEVHEVREKVLELQQRLEVLHDRTMVEEENLRLQEENLRLSEEILLIRDDLIGQEARLGEALGENMLLERELSRNQEGMAEADRLLGSRTGRLLRAWHRMRAPRAL